MKTGRRLMILGSSEEFEDLVQLAVRQGIYTVVCDGYRGNPAKKWADRAYDENIFDVEAVAEICRRERVDHILTAYSDVLFEQTVKIAAAAGLPCYLTPDELPVYREKDRQKELMRRAGIDTPRSVRLTADFRTEDLRDLEFPLVIKPVNGYGSKGVYVVGDETELRYFYPMAQACSKEEGILAEEYCAWPEYNSMAWVHRGKVTVFSVNDRERVDQGPHRVPLLSRIVYPSRHLSELIGPVEELYTAFARAAGQTEGPISLQFFWRPGEKPKVCEFAGRTLAYEHEIPERLSGLSLPQLYLDSLYDEAALERTLAAHSPFFGRTAAGIYYVARDRQIRDLSKIREIAAWPGVFDTALYYKEGESYDSHGYYAYLVRYFIEADSREDLDALTQRIYDEARVPGPAGENILIPFRLPEEETREDDLWTILS